MKSRFLCALLAVSVLAGISSCKKTVELPAQPNSKILEYKVPVSDGNISGVIDEGDKTITVYVPFYYQLDVIDPKIKLADGASLKDKVEPVDVMDTGTTYTVTGADKSTTTYKLVIKLQQLGPLVVEEISSATKTEKWGIGFYNVRLRGNFNTSDATKVKAFLVGADNKEYALVNSPNGAPGIQTSMGVTDKIYTLFYLQVPQTIEPGLYKLKVQIQSLSTVTKYPIEIFYDTPQINYVGAEAKTGGTFNVITTGPVFHNFKEFSITVNGQKLILPIESYTRTKAVIRVPENVPLGVYNPTAVFDGWPPIFQYWTLTVKPK